MSDVFMEIFSELPRGGPGDNRSTGKAWSMMPGLPVRPRILDVGCGPGMQTLELARLSGGDITALDSYGYFLQRLDKAAGEAGLADNIRTKQASMLEMDFAPESFDVIWSEGAIFICGFNQGLRDWKKFLRPGGYLAVTEAVFLRDDLPDEVLRFWKQEYPPIGSVDDNIACIRENGYELTGNFTLPESSWWDNYYHPMEKRLREMEDKYRGNSEALAIIAHAQREIEVYRKYSSYYGYEFFIMKKI